MSNYYDVDKRSNANQANPNGGMQYPAPHHGMVSEYQQSGIPFVFYKAVGALSPASIVTITLPYVSRWIKLSVVSTAGTCRIGFGDNTSSLGVRGDNYILAPVLTAITAPLELKCKVIKIYVPADQDDCVINLIAGLTNVRDFPSLDQAGLSGITTSAAVSNVAAVVYAVASAT